MKAFEQAVKILVIASMIMLAAVIYSCSENKGGGKGNVSNAQNNSAGDFIMVSGEQHSTTDVLTSPLMRNALREYCYSMTMLKKAREANIEVSDEDVNERLEETKVVIDQRNTTWEHYLESQFLTEEEYWLNTKYSIMFERLVESKVEITEEDKLDLWDAQQTSIIDQYLSDNHLPESERSSVEFELVEDICTERAMNVLKQQSLVDVRREIIEESSLELSLVSDEAARKQFEDLILNKAREAQAEQAAAGSLPSTAK